MNKLLKTLVCDVNPRFHAVAPAIGTAPLDRPPFLSGGISGGHQGVDFGCQTQQTEYAMRKVLLVICSLAFSTATMANVTNCQTAATAQKLVGTAKTAFLKKCETESTNRLTLVSKNKNMSVAPTSEFSHCSHSDKDL